MKYLLNLILLLTSLSLTGQHVLSGSISSADRNKLIGATVFFLNTDIADATVDDGSYYIEDIPSGTYTVQYSYLGYEDYTVELNITEDMQYDVELTGTFYKMDEIQISDNRVDSSSPFTYSEMDHDELMEKNTGVDVPILLNGLTNVQTTSDAGHGIGYTSMRIRGSDQSRINVTINGVPLNDAESQSVFWVDLPDFASSVDNIQVQRGVGTSTNGPSAFGGTVGLNTHQLNGDAYIESSGTIGSFGTNKFNVKLGTGILNDRFSVDTRYSLVNSDGYIDRSNAKLNSWMISPAVYWDDAVLRLDIFSGREVTNQAWFGVPEARLGDDQAAIDDHYNRNRGELYVNEADSLNYYNSDRRYNYYLYENQIDDYQQDHVQLHYYKTFSDAVTSRVTAYFTHGAGFFEEYRINESLDFYDIEPGEFVIDGDTLFRNDVIRRRALDNNLFGMFTNNTINPLGSKFGFDVGGGISRYTGDHFGYVTELVDIATRNIILPYYSNTGIKTDYNVYGKSKFQVNESWSSLADLQIRGINYTIDGDDNKIKGINLEQDWFFFNPKAGITYQRDSLKAYASIAIANREPDRNDILNAIDLNTQPTHETLYNAELGAQKVFGSFGVKANLYYMYYQNQLVLTGELNDVGANLRANVDESYRAGVELELDARLGSRLMFGGNLALSQNKITEFDEIIYNYTVTDTEVIINNFEDVDIAFSPSIIAGGEITGRIIKPLSLSLIGKYVGQQYLDNTQNDDRLLPSYFTLQSALRYNPQINNLKNISVGLNVYNLLSTLYSANGYTYSYGFESQFVTENFFYPQATRHFMLTATIRI